MAEEDKLSFLDDKESPPPTPEPKAQDAPAPQVPEPQAPAPTDQPKPAPKEPGEWTVAMAMDERDKRIAIARERDELAAWKAEQLAKAEKPPEIDPFTDPEGWKAEQRREAERIREDTTFKMTHYFAVKAHGEEVVRAAENWLGEEIKTNPSIYQRLAGQADPYEALVQAHKRQQTLAKLGDKDPETWAEEWARSKGYVLAEQPPAPAEEPSPGEQPRAPNGQFAAAAPAPATPAPLPKRSLAAAPAASGNTPQVPLGPGVAFDAVFKN